MVCDWFRHWIQAFKAYAQDHRRSIAYCLFGLFFCVL